MAGQSKSTVIGVGLAVGAIVGAFVGFITGNYSVWVPVGGVFGIVTNLVLDSKKT